MIQARIAGGRKVEGKRRKIIPLKLLNESHEVYGDIFRLKKIKRGDCQLSERSRMFLFPPSNSLTPPLERP